MLGNRPATDRAIDCGYGHTYFVSDAASGPSCPTCYDIGLASDMYKEINGTRYHGGDMRYLLSQYGPGSWDFWARVR